MAPAFEAQLSGLTEGEYTEPFEEGGGLHILRLDRVIEAGNRKELTDDRREELRDQLYDKMLDERMQRWVREDLHKKHHVAIRLSHRRNARRMARRRRRPEADAVADAEAARRIGGQRSRSLAVSLGDPAGIGPEIVVRAAASSRVRSLCRLVVFGDAGCSIARARVCGIDVAPNGDRERAAGRPRRTRGKSCRSRARAAAKRRSATWKRRRASGSPASMRRAGDRAAQQVLAQSRGPRLRRTHRLPVGSGRHAGDDDARRPQAARGARDHPRRDRGRAARARVRGDRALRAGHVRCILRRYHGIADAAPRGRGPQSARRRGRPVRRRRGAHHRAGRAGIVAPPCTWPRDRFRPTRCLRRS